MYNFGKFPPRSLESFGISGVLADDCVVFYDSLFTPKHIGKVSDLLSARIRDLKPDELKLRALILYTILEAYRIQSSGSLDLPLPEPITIECGLDSEKIAIGVSFILPKELALEFSGLPERILTQINTLTPAHPIERLLTYLSKHAPKVILRFDPNSFRLEVISLLGIPGQVAEVDLLQHEIIVVPVLEAEETPKAAENVELGDLNYLELLPEDQPGIDGKTQSAGEELAKISGSNAFQIEAGVKAKGKQEEESTQKISGSGVVDEHSEKVKGHSDSDDSEKIISGSGSETEHSEKVKGRNDTEDNFENVIAGSKLNDDGEDSKIANKADIDNFKKTVTGSTSSESQDKTIFKAKKMESDNSDLEDELNSVLNSDFEEEKKKIKGDKEDYSSKTVIRGNEEPKSALKSLKKLFNFGNDKALEEENATLVKGPDNKQSKLNEIQVEQYKNKIEELQAEIENLKSKNLEKNDHQDTESEEIQTSSKKTQKKKDPSALAAFFGGSNKNKLESKSANVEELIDEFEEEIDNEESFRPKAKKVIEDDEDDLEDESEDSESALDTIKNWFKVPAAPKVETKKVKAAVVDDDDSDEDINIVKNIEALTKDADKKIEILSKEDEKIIKELGEERLVTVVKKAESEVVDIKSEIKSERAQKWVDGLMGELVAEKAHLTDLAKKINAQMRQKDNEFRNREQVLKTEAQKAVDQLRQKTTQLSRTKEQLNQMNAVMEQNKNNPRSAAEDRQFKQKFQQVQKQYTAVKDENTKLSEKLLEMRNQLAKGQTQKSVNEPQGQSIESKEKLDRAVKEIEELKKINSKLQSKVDDTKKDKTTGALSFDEMRQKMDMATKDKMTARRRSETLQIQLDESKREAEKLRRDTEKAQAEVRKLRIAASTQAAQQPIKAPAAQTAAQIAAKKPSNAA